MRLIAVLILFFSLLSPRVFADPTAIELVQLWINQNYPNCDLKPTIPEVDSVKKYEFNTAMKNVTGDECQTAPDRIPEVCKNRLNEILVPRYEKFVKECESKKAKIAAEKKGLKTSNLVCQGADDKNHDFHKEDGKCIRKVNCTEKSQFFAREMPKGDNFIRCSIPSSQKCEDAGWDNCINPESAEKSWNPLAKPNFQPADVQGAR